MDNDNNSGSGGCAEMFLIITLFIMVALVVARLEILPLCVNNGYSDVKITISDKKLVRQCTHNEIDYYVDDEGYVHHEP